MAKKPYIIITASPKGGVGKTIVSINVAAALKTAGYDVLIIDTDVANPSVGVLLGATGQEPGYAELVTGDAKFKDVLILFPQSGFYYINAGGDGEIPKFTPDQISGFYSEISKSDFDFVIVDTPPGTDLAAAMRLFNEALIVTTPEETAVKGAERLSRAYQKKNLMHKLVINRIKGGKFDLGEDMIEKLYGDVAYAMIPEEKSVEESEARHVPAYLLNRTSLFALAIDNLCRSYVLKAGVQQDGGTGKGPNQGGIKKLFGLK